MKPAPPVTSEHFITLYFRKAVYHPRRGRHRLVAKIGFLALFNEAHWIKAPVPFHGDLVHLQPVRHSFARLQPLSQHVTHPSQPQVQEHDFPNSTYTRGSVMLVEVTILAAICLQRKTNWKPSHRLPAKVRDLRDRTI